MASHSHSSWIVLAVIGASLASSCAEPCERRRQWRNEAASECQACSLMHCGTEATAVSGAPGACSPEFACAARCADHSATTCECVSLCLATQTCRTRYDAWVSCLVARCDAVCH